MKTRILSRKSSAGGQTQIVLRDEDIQKISKAVTTAILEAEQQKTTAQNECVNMEEHPKRTTKDVLRILFVPVKKLKVENSALSLVKMITSLTCWLVSRVGYIFSGLLLLSAVIYACGNLTVSAIITVIYVLPFVAIIWMIARMIDAAGVEIENSNNHELVFGLSAFLLAIIAILVSLLKKGG